LGQTFTLVLVVVVVVVVMAVVGVVWGKGGPAS
jgi:hypothetical protein